MYVLGTNAFKLDSALKIFVTPLKTSKRWQFLIFLRLLKIIKQGRHQKISKVTTDKKEFEPLIQIFIPLFLQNDYEESYKNVLLLISLCTIFAKTIFTILIYNQ